MDRLQSNLFIDPQCRPEKRCPVCGGCVYPPTYHCIRCERGRRP